MDPAHVAPTHPLAVVVLALSLALAPATVIAQSGDPSGSGGDDAPEEGNQSGSGENGTNGSNDTSGNQGNSTDDRSSENGTNESTRDDANASSRSQTDPNGSERGDEDRTRQGEDPRAGAGDGQGSASDRVRIEDRPGGFATRAPAGSQRPTVQVDVDEARVTVERPDVRPLSVHLDTVVEHVDENGNGAYDVGEQVVNRTELGDLEPEVTAGPTDRTRSVVYPLEGEGRLVLRFGFSDAQGSQVATKFDVLVEDHPFADPGTRIALGSRVQIPGGGEVVDADGVPALAGQQGDEVAYLSWTPHVEVDGVQRSVGWSVHVSTASSTGEEGAAIVYWSYPQGDRIVHDPELGVMDAVRDLPGRTSAFGIGVAVTLAVLTVGYVARRRGGL